MVFVDTVGFFAFVCLWMQAALAGCLLAFLFVVTADRMPWLIRLRLAIGVLALGFFAIATRFTLLFQDGPDSGALRDGQLIPGVLYGVYVTAKLGFWWFLLGAIASIRGRPWPRFGWLGAALLLGCGVVAGCVDVVDQLVLAQVPAVVMAGFYGAAMLWPVRPGRADVGHRVVAVVLAAMACLWLLYAVAVVCQAFGVAESSFWVVVLRNNSVWDFLLQVVFAIGIVTMMMDGANAELGRAQHERDLLQERVEQDEKLRALSTLVAGAAHEINNPLTSILGFSDQLMMEDPEARRHAARVIQEQAVRCRHIVKRMSVLTHAREPRPRRVEMRDFVQRVVRGLAPQFEAANVRLHVAEIASDCVVRAEPAALDQILTVLLVNALQAAPPDTAIWVDVVAAEESITLVVEDEGLGVPEADRARIFEPLFTTKVGTGSGLGLAVARTLVRAHGGTIRVVDGAVGARFVVMLPRGEHGPDAHDSDPVLETDERLRVRGARMLVIDDEPLVRESIRRHALAAGWQVDESDSAEGALRRLLEQNERFDAVACDLRMPGLSGFDLYERLATDAPDLLRRMVFITGDLASEEAAQFAERTQAPIFTKPFDYPELLDCLRGRVTAESVGGDSSGRDSTGGDQAC